MTSTVDTSGWHTVSAITYAALNQVLSTTGAEEAFQQASSDGSTSVHGTFGPWSLTTGGAGPILAMALPLTSGFITIQGAESPLTPATVTVQVRALFVPAPGQNGVQNLVNDPDQPIIVTQCVPPQSSTLVQGALIALIRTWLNANASQLNTVFGAVNFNAQYTQPGLSWLKPSAIGYAVAEPARNASLSNSVFAVLCLIDGEEESRAQEFDVSPFVIPDGADASFVVSAEKFLEHMVMPSLPRLFQNVANPSSSFAISNDGTEILNTEKLTLNPCELDDGTVVSPTVDERTFSVNVDGDQLLLDIAGMSFPYSSGTTVSINYSVALTLSLDAPGMTISSTQAYAKSSGSVSVSEGQLHAQQISMAIAIGTSLVAALAGLGAVAIGTTAETGNAVRTEIELQPMNNPRPLAIQEDQVPLLGQQGPSTLSQFSAKLPLIAAGTSLLSAAAYAYNYAVTNWTQAPPVTVITDALIQNVSWPLGSDKLELTSVQVNGGLQFGLKRQSIDSQNRH